MKFLLALVSFTLLCWGCTNNKHEYPKAENAFDAGREFIDGCLKGDFEKANAYMLSDEANTTQLKKLEADYKKKSKNDQQQYQDASINILDDDEVNLDDYHHYTRQVFD